MPGGNNFDSIIRSILNSTTTHVSDTMERPTKPSDSKYDTLNMPKLEGIDFENMIRGKTTKPIKDET